MRIRTGCDLTHFRIVVQGCSHLRVPDGVLKWGYLKGFHQLPILPSRNETFERTSSSRICCSVRLPINFI
jgi:hypothetical protein